MKHPKYRKHSSRDLGFVQWDKKRIYFPGPYGSHESKKAFRHFIQGHVILPAKPIPSTGSLSVAKLAVYYLGYAKKHYGEGRTEYGNMRASIGPFTKACGAESAESFGPRKLKDYRQTLVATRRSRSYINGIINRIKRMFRWGVSEELIPASVYHGLQSVSSLAAGRTEARETPKRQPVKWDDVAPVIAELSSTVAAMVMVQWYTGVRSKSLCYATPSQFDMSGDMWLWRPRHKTESLGKSVIIAIGPKCRKVLEPLIQRGPDDYLFNPRHQNKNRRYNARYTTGAYAYAVARAIRRVNKQRAKEELPPVKHWSPHQLRHSKGHAVRNAYGLEAAQATLGHGTIDATELYSEPRLELAKRVARETG